MSETIDYYLYYFDAIFTQEYVKYVLKPALLCDI